MTVHGHKLNLPRFEMGENARMAFQTLREHKMRSLLTVLGVVIGVTALIAVGSIVVGLDKDVRSFLEDYGTETLFVFGLATLFWLSVRRASPRAGKLFGAFVAAIWIASVHLAYHYAVDGLVAVIATYAIWRFVDWALARWDALLPRLVQPALRTNTVPAE